MLRCPALLTLVLTLGVQSSASPDAQRAGVPSTLGVQRILPASAALQHSERGHARCLSRVESDAESPLSERDPDDDDQRPAALEPHPSGGHVLEPACSALPRRSPSTERRRLMVSDGLARGPPQRA